MQSEPGSSPPDTKRPRRLRLKLTLSLLGAGAGILWFGGWYLTRCEGRWQGVPLEAQARVNLEGVKQALRADVAYVQALGPRNSESDKDYAQLQACAEWIGKQWQHQGYTVRRQEYVVKGRGYTNLEVEIPGTTKPTEIVIISAQYDTLPGSPGANNNASGMAALFRVSEMLQGQRLERTLRLVEFVNEEDPFFGTEQMGSYVYAKACRERGDDICAMLSLDSIGIYKHEAGSQKLPWPFSQFYPDRGDFLAFIGNLPSRECVKATTRGFRQGTSLPLAAGLAPAWVPGASWSDHSSFWKFGYPGVQVTDTGGFRSAFHTTSQDTLEKLDFDALARVSLGIYGAALELGSAQSQPGSRQLPSHWLVLNGAVVLLIGLLAGWPMRQAIVGNKPGSVYRGWRVAHATFIAQALVMFAIGLALPQLKLEPGNVWVMVWGLVAGGYGFVFAMTIGAWTGLRALSPKPWGLNTLLFAGHVLGAAGSLMAGCLVVRGAFLAL
jgi:hypothetical protein